MDKKKFNIIIVMLALCLSLSVLSLALSIVVLYSNSHVHTFAEDWNSDSMYHWHDATCEHQIENSRREHVYTTSESKCDVCGYVVPTQGLEYSPDGNLLSIVKVESYSVVGRGTATSLDINVPATYKGKPVTGIGNRAFANDSLNSILLPDSITFIGSDAFNGCANLSSVNIPSRTATIGNSAFYGCSSLTSVTIPESVATIGSNAFSNCDAMIIYCQATTKPSNWDYYWSGYSSSRPIVWDCDNNDKDKYGYAYTIYNGLSYCVKDGDTQLNIQPSNLLSANFTEKIIFKDTEYPVSKIQPYTFALCSNLEQINVTESHPDYKSEGNCLLTKDGSALILGSNNSIIPNGVTEIRDSAFYNRRSITDLVIPDSVTTIGYGAFWQCENLKSVKFGNNVTEIGNNAFYNCPSLTDIILPQNLTHIGSNAFNGCIGLEKLIIPDSVTSIEQEAFMFCTKLTRLTIGSGLTDINERAFANCNIDNLIIPANVKTIGEGAFAECKNIVNVTFNSGLEIIDSYAFQNCANLISIDLPDSVTTVNEKAFADCEHLESISFGKGATTIANNVFDKCRNIKSLTVDKDNSVYKSINNCLLNNSGQLIIGGDSGIIPEGTIEIGRYAFSNKDGFDTVTIPSSVTTIKSWAFSECHNLQRLTIGSNVTVIDTAAFRGCNNLQTIIFDGTVAQWNAIDTGLEWIAGVPATKIVCTDGEVTL